MDQIRKIKSIKSVLVTTTRAYSQEGSMAADLASMVAQNNKRVALIDADLRKPMIHTLFNLPNRVGLIDVLQSNRHLSAAMHPVNGSPLFVLPTGRHDARTMDVFKTASMAELLDQLRAQFDKIIVHGPPFFYTETTTLAGLVDGVVLLIHPGHSKSDPSRAIIEKIQKTGATVIGIVMRDQPRPPINQSTFINRLLSYDRKTRLYP